MTIRPRKADILARLESERDTLRSLGVGSLALFGSVARDEAGPGSDVDLLVQFEEHPTYVRYFELKTYLEDVLAFPVDLVLEDGLRARVAPYVHRDAVRVA